ncbi:molybdopterin adenylyltransferase [Rhodoblastus sphagnicola]|uniref:Molybdopterin adenylyltransferase n=1 Tax=Rhodoblastus sphagnicola TaxID=333368 RepID=A0A2S6N565_9HYPH|nr:molybdopterin adenylyltransferase [Rhodoblastus sphagnicola]MBB4197136.1 molybdopterin adenylyltransferase [Rhodoblastus sphagnicola]PPQ29756.1 molybdopterin adenylyltransferase [Rhodoblastus sphagnicola]
MTGNPAKIGVLTISDRASAGIYEDISGPAIRDWLARALSVSFELDMRVIPDGFERVRDEIIDMADVSGCCLVLTTGGTGPAPRDLTPEATLAACHREMPGFGELMRMKSLEQTPTAILSRQTAAHRGACLVVNLPGSPRSIDLCLSAVFPAIPYCVELIGGSWLDTHAEVVTTVRPKK